MGGRFTSQGKTISTGNYLNAIVSLSLGRLRKSWPYRKGLNELQLNPPRPSSDRLALVPLGKVILHDFNQVPKENYGQVIRVGSGGQGLSLPQIWNGCVQGDTRYPRFQTNPRFCSDLSQVIYEGGLVLFGVRQGFASNIQVKGWQLSRSNMVVSRILFPRGGKVVQAGLLWGDRLFQQQAEELNHAN